MALSRAMEWIAECTSNHKFCGDDSPKLLPTRVLDLSTDEAGRHARIVMGGGEMSRYGTLSHCWGQRGNHRILTKATLKSWLKPFGITELPQTYQDAIMVTKRLGLRYLWVDSLCILQDVEEDWKRESSKMAEIYQNSYITVAATCAADSSAGIFLTARLIYNPKAIQYAGNGIEMQLYAHACLSHRTYDPVDRSHNSFYRWNLQDPVDFPLLSRAWVYQERLLSPRILHFLREELVFECCESQSETRSPLYPPIWNTRWYNIVGEYTKLKMSFEKDKLTALSGVASQMQGSRHDLYLAGLWKSTYLRDLAWRTDIARLRERPKTWRARSWS
ncbi:HET-domain-containing protein [Cadophora sp. DSE1049]|nr:HET-domain-containing protein [Cadophora sp. DSE1049]